MQLLEKPTNVYLLLGLAATAFFSLSLISGHPITLHEGILVQGAREMWASASWWIPRSGGRPWVECPPLPFWIVSVFAGLGGYDHTWIFRIAPTLAGTLGVLCVTWIGARLFDLRTALIAGFLLTSTFEYARFALSVDDEIFLTALTTLTMAAFVTSLSKGDTRERFGFFSGREAAVGLFFLALGTCNLVKGFFFGNALTLTPILAYSIWQRDLTIFRRYFWFWGWLVFAVLTFTWPVSVQLAQPGSVAVWSYDLFGRINGGNITVVEGPFYYLPALLHGLLPWICLAPLAIRSAFKARTDREKFLLCWAIVPVLLLSLLTGKHHHYLLPCFPAWVLLFARWLAPIVRFHPKKFAGVVALAMVAFAVGYISSSKTDPRIKDIPFLKSIGESQGVPLLINADLEPLDNFRILYELGHRGRLIQNLSFLLDDALPNRVWLITRADDEPALRWFGSVKKLSQSLSPHWDGWSRQRLTLFEVVIDPSLKRVSTKGVSISPMQTMLRQPGPFLTSGLNYNLWKQQSE